jgi:microcin C transport system substrate-binding protein
MINTIPLLKSVLIYTLFTSYIHALEATEAAQGITSSHGFALYGDLKYPADFSHFDYVNPNAPKGGDLHLMGFGSYDSLNPYTLKGVSPFNTPGQFMYGFTELNETLLVGTGEYSPSGDEPQSAYGLIAQSLTYPLDTKWVRFSINPAAKFHDGHAIDAQDVAFSYNILTTQGHPRFQQTLLGVQAVTVIDKHTVQIDFKEANQPANILRIGEMPVLPEHFWRGKDFEKSTQISPLLSGPYRIKDYKIGHSIHLQREPNAWTQNLSHTSESIITRGQADNSKTLNVYTGRYNFDDIYIDYYRDQAVAFEGFKSGNFDLFYDYTAKNWAMAYDFPALKNGEVLKEEIEHNIPSTTQAFFFNTRRSFFKDARVRQALSLLFDYEWTNKALFNGAYRRNTSYFPNSDFASSGLPQGEELALLSRFKTQLPPSLFSKPFTQAITKGDGNIRPQIKTAFALLAGAGWVMKDNVLSNSQTGEIFEFEILIRQAGIQRVLLPFIKNLERIGIKASARLIDTAQYKVRLDQFDFDMTTASLAQGHAPSYEQRDYFHSSSQAIEGSQNYAGINDPVVDELIAMVLASTSREQLVPAMKALDRVLLWQHYTIPNWHLDYHRLAHWDKFGRPQNPTPYKLGIENWWLQ